MELLFLAIREGHMPTASFSWSPQLGHAARAHQLAACRARPAIAFARRRSRLACRACRPSKAKANRTIPIIQAKGSGKERERERERDQLAGRFGAGRALLGGSGICATPRHAPPRPRPLCSYPLDATRRGADRPAPLAVHSRGELTTSSGVSRALLTTVRPFAGVIRAPAPARGTSCSSGSIGQMWFKAKLNFLSKENSWVTKGSLPMQAWLDSSRPSRIMWLWMLCPPPFFTIFQPICFLLYLWIKLVGT
jgi:hypothetical protein